MGYDEETVERVRSILAGRPDVIERRMIGGLSFMVGGRMCCGVTGVALMVRLDPETYEWALAQLRVRPMEFAGRPLKSFVRVDPDGYQAGMALAAWVQRGIDCVAIFQRKRPPRGNVSSSAEETDRALAGAEPRLVGAIPQIE